MRNLWYGLGAAAVTVPTVLCQAAIDPNLDALIDSAELGLTAVTTFVVAVITLGFLVYLARKARRG